MNNTRDAPDPVLLPSDPSTGEPLAPRTQPGYYPKFSTLSQSAYWEDATRDVVQTRVEAPPSRKFFSEDEWSFWTLVFNHLIPQTDRAADRQIPVIAPLDHRLFTNQTVGYRYANMPPDREVYRIGIHAINQEAEQRYGGTFPNLPHLQQDLVLQAIRDGKPEGAPDIWKKMSVHRFWQMLMGDAIDGYYAHPWSWDEVGFGGPAYPRAYTRLERGEPEPWEVREKRYAWASPVSSVSDQTESNAHLHLEADQFGPASTKGTS